MQLAEKIKNSNQQLAAGKSKYMQLTIDEIDLLMPQGDIKTFESINELDTSNRLEKSVGWVESFSQKVPVYCFDRDLNLLDELPANRSVCVIFEQIGVGIMCSEIKVLSYSSIDEYPLPDCMQGSATPVSSMCLFVQDDITCLGMIYSANTLNHYIGRSSTGKLE